MIFADWDGDILVDVERNDQALREYVDDVVVAVGTVVEVDAKRVLPLLGLENVVSVRSVKDEALEIQFADAFDSGTNFEVGIEIVTDAVLAFEEADLGVEVRADSSMVAYQFQPVALVMETAAEVGLS